MLISCRLERKMKNRNGLEQAKSYEKMSANMANVLLHSRQGHRSQYFKPLSNVFLFENESEKQRYNNNHKKLEELKEKLIAKPEQQFMIASAVKLNN